MFCLESIKSVIPEMFCRGSRIKVFVVAELALRFAKRRRSESAVAGEESRCKKCSHSCSSRNPE